MIDLSRMLLIPALVLISSASVAAAGTFEEALVAYDEAIASREVDHEGYATAYAIWKDLAADDHDGAQYHLGMLHWFGLGGADQDQSRALILIQASARAG